MIEDKLLYGAVFLLEKDFTEKHMRENVAKMRKLNMNTAVVWPPVFYEGETACFEQHRKFLDIAEEHGMKVIVELTGQVPNLEYFPDFIYSDEYAVRNFDGTVEKMQNGLGEMNYNHPFVKKTMRKAFGKIVNALKEHPALAAWDIWNETHFKSFDKYTLAEFQAWLVRKYEHIEKINRSWGKTYSDFLQVCFEKVTWASIMPDVDFEEFRTDNLAAITAELAGYVKECDMEHPVIADNVMSNAVWGEFDRGTDDSKVAMAADHYGISFYPKTGGRLLKDNEQWLRSLTFDSASAAANGKFFVSEMQSHYYSEIFTRERVSPEDLTAWCFEALSRNCTGIVFWKWAPFKRGFQVGGRGLVRADGSLSGRAEAAASVGKFMADNAGIIDAKIRTDIGVLFDRHNNFTVKTINNRISHIVGNDQPQRGLFGLYKTCFKNNVPLRIIEKNRLRTELESLKVLFMPYQVSIDTETAGIVRAFVERGGTLIANYPFADVSEDGMLFETLPGGPLNEILGVRHLDNLCFEKSKISFDDGQTLAIECESEIQELALNKDSEAIAEINDYPFLTQRKVGAGKVFYFTAPVWNMIYDSNLSELGDALLERLCGEALKKREAVADVPLCIAEHSNEKFLFVFNEKILNEIEIEFSGSCGSPELIFGDAELAFREKNIMSIKGQSCVYVLKI